MMLYAPIELVWFQVDQRNFTM